MCWSHHRAVQSQKQTIRLAVAEPSAKLFRDLIEDRIGNGTTRRRPGHQQGDQLEPLHMGGFDKAAQLMMSITPFVEHLRTAGEAAGQESIAVGKLRMESIRFVHEAGNSNSHIRYYLSSFKARAETGCPRQWLHAR